MIDLSSLSSRELLRLYASILTELGTRRVVRSRNAPAGDLAELLVALAYHGELADRSGKSWDVRAHDMRLLQVKCRVLPKGDRSTQFFSPFRSWDFHAAVFVTLDSETYDVAHATEVPVDAVREIGRYTEWVKGTQIRANQQLGRLPDAVDVTADLQRALDNLP